MNGRPPRKQTLEKVNLINKLYLQLILVLAACSGMCSWFSTPNKVTKSVNYLCNNLWLLSGRLPTITF